MSSFVHLHTHTTYSGRDGMAQLAPLVRAAAADGQPALAVTDHGNLGAAWKFTKLAKAAGVKPITGIEAYLAHGSRLDHQTVLAADDEALSSGDEEAAAGRKQVKYHHLTVLAATREGWRNLAILDAEAHAPESFWARPRMDMDLLAKHNGGLIALTGCIGGPVASPLAAGDAERAEANLARLHDIFGDRLYVEVMDHGIPGERRVVGQLIELAKRHGIQVVVTNDSHFVRPDESAAHDAWLCVGSNALLDDPKRWRFHGEGYWLRTSAEMHALFDDQPGTEDAVSTTLAIAERIEDNVLPEKTLRLPSVGGDADKALYRKVADGAVRRYGAPLPQPVKERLRYEYDIITRARLSDYFLIVEDMITWARANGIMVGAGRGCLTGGTLVWTTNGYTPISDVREGDVVRSHLGTLRPVTRTFRYEVDEDLVTLRTFADGNGVTMTADHKVLVRRAEYETDHKRTKGGAVYTQRIGGPVEWLPASDIRKGDLLCVPRPPSPGTAPKILDVAAVLGRAPTGVTFEVTADEIVEKVPTNKPYPHSVRDVARTTGLGRNVIQSLCARKVPDEGPVLHPWRGSMRRSSGSERSRDKLVVDLRERGFDGIAGWDAYVGAHAVYEVRTPRFIPVDDDLCFVIGAWASNGWLRDGSERLVGFAERANTASDDIRVLVKRIWGLDVTEQRHNQQDLVQYAVRSAAVYFLFRHLFPRYKLSAQTKHLPDWAHELDRGKKLHLLDGLWWGDGSRSGGRWTYSTSSPALVQGVRDLLWAVGAPAGVTKDDRMDKRAAFSNRTVAWRVSTTPGFLPHRAHFGGTDDDYVYVRVRSIVKGRRSTSVFDLEVPGEHSFMTDSFVVHNSAAGSAVAYCLGIVQVDPIKHGLLFERFLSPDRTGLPDIDTDFEQAGTAKVFEHLAARWGTDNVSRIGTYNIALSAASLRLAAKVLDAAPLGAKLAATVPTGSGGKPYTFAELSEDNQATAPFRRAVATAPKCKDIVKLASYMEGQVNAESVHACGVVVSSEPLPGLVPMRRDSRDHSIRVSEWDGKDIEELGLVKLDVLGLRNLDIISTALRMIELTTGEQIDPYSLPEDMSDSKAAAAWRLIAEGRTAGVFQLESAGMTKLAAQIRPQSLDELSDVIALFRPGPLQAGLHTVYAERKAGTSPTDYTLFTSDPWEAEQIASVLGSTYGVPVYQEQLMRLGEVVAGFGPVNRDRLRKAVAKKLQDEMAAVGQLFVAGAQSDRDDAGNPRRPFSRATAEKVWDAIKGAGSYAFNASHSLGYAKLAYVTAFLKANWPGYFAAGVLSNTDDDDRRIATLHSMRSDGIEVRGPDVNLSQPRTTVEADGTVRLGLTEVKGVGDLVRAIVDEREQGGPFSSLIDLYERVKVPDKKGGPLKKLTVNKLEALVEAGALDAFGPRLGQMMILHAIDSGPAVPDAEWGPLERAARERKRLGVLLSTSPLVELSDEVQRWRAERKPQDTVVAVHRLASHQGKKASTIGVLASLKVIKKGARRAYITIEGSRGSIGGIIWGRELDGFEARGLPQVGDIVAVDGVVQRAVPRRKPTDANDDAEDDYAAAVDDEDDEVAPPEDPEDQVEMVVNGLWAVPLTKARRVNLAKQPVPAA